MTVKSLSSRVQLFATPCRLQPTRLLCQWDFPGKSTGVGYVSVTILNLFILRYSLLLFCFTLPFSFLSFFPPHSTAHGFPFNEARALSLKFWSNRECQATRNINQSDVSQRSASQHQDLALSNCLQPPLLETSGQTTSKTGKKAYPSKKKKRKRKMK